MKKSDREKFKLKIVEQLRLLKSNISDLKDLTKPIAPENAIGRLSRMDAINNKSVNEAALSTALQKLKKLEFALNRVDSEDFGICIRCKQDIPEGRLLFMPESTNCVECADR